MDSQLDIDEMRATLEKKIASTRSRLHELETALEGLNLAVKHCATTANGPVRRNGQLTNVVASAIRSMEGDFTARDVTKALEKRGEAEIKRSTLSSVLRRLTHDNALESVVDGRGKRASVFRRVEVEHSDNTDEPPF